MEDKIIDLKNITLLRSDKLILKNINWQLNRYQHTAVVGANGSGKTTLLKIVAATLFPTSGDVTVLGNKFGRVDLRELRKKIGWVSSALQDKMPPSQTITEIVISGLYATLGMTGYPDNQFTKEDEEKATDIIDLLGLQKVKYSPFSVLSHGEQQKTLFARALISKPEILILDEPCSGLDIWAREAFLETVNKIAKQKKTTMIMVTHHIEDITNVFSSALLIKDASIFAQGKLEDTLTSKVLSQVFAVPVIVEEYNQRRWTKVVERNYESDLLN